MITAQDLRGIAAFAELDDSALSLIASRCGDLRVDPDEVVISQGDVARFFCVISGAVQAIERAAGAIVSLATFHAGDSFGEVPLVIASAAMLTIRATEATRLAVLDRTEFWRLMHAQAPFAATVSANMATRIAAFWSAAMEAPPAQCTIVGDAHSPQCHRLRDFLTRLDVFFDWQERDGPTCDVTFPDGRHLLSPDVRELAQALDLRTAPERHCYDVAIVGGGPAGLAAAVYGASEGLRTVLVDRDAPGGQAGMSSRIENYLGFPNGISGEALADRAYAQAMRFGADVVVAREAIRVEGEAYDRYVVLDGEERIHCRAIVLAMGVSYRPLTARGCDDFFNRGVYYGAAQAEARRVAGHRIHLLGGGNSAGQAAMYFSTFAEHVTIVIRAADIAASMSQYLIDELSRRANVSIVSSTEVVGVEGDRDLETIVMRSIQDGSQRRESSDALFVFIGADPHSQWLGDTVATDDRGYVLTGPDAANQATHWTLSRQPFLLECSQPGIFAAGDVRKGSVKRVASSVGEGATAITMVHQILAEMKRPIPAPLAP